MCGCGGFSGGKVNSTACQGRVSDLHKIRNSLITLEKLTNNLDKKQEYKEVRGQVEEMLKNTNTCPDLSTIVALKNYVANEHTEHHN